MRKVITYKKRDFRPFIIKVNSGADSSFTIPTNGGYNYNYRVETSDGQRLINQTGNCTIIFPDANTLYDVSISGYFPKPEFATETKIKQIIQFGEVEFESFNLAFYNCINLEGDSLDSPNITSITNFYRAFYGTKYNGDIGSWNWANINNAREMLYSNTIFNKNLSNIDLSNINLGIGGFFGFVNRCSNFDNDNTKLVWDFENRAVQLGTYPFTDNKVKEMEFLNARNVSWGTALKINNPDNILEKIILEDFDRNINFGARFSGSLRALTGEGIKELIDRVDITAAKTLTLYPTVYDNLETYLQGLGYTGIQDYLTQTNNNWTIIV